jgi:hypothetical protein
MPRFGKAVQHEDEIATRRARNIRGEDKTRPGLEFRGIDHAL